MTTLQHLFWSSLKEYKQSTLELPKGRKQGDRNSCLANQDHLNISGWHQSEAELLLHKADNSTSVLYDKQILAWLLIDKEIFLAGAGWEGIRSSFLSWFQIRNVEVSSSNVNWHLDSVFLGWVFFLVQKGNRKAEKIPSQLSVGEWKRSLSVPSRGSRAWERTTYADVPTSLELAMHFSCSHLGQSSPKNGWYPFITQPPIIWERAIQYYRDTHICLIPERSPMSENHVDQYLLFPLSDCKWGRSNLSSGRELDQTFLFLHSVAGSWYWTTHFSPGKVVLTSFCSCFYGLASHLLCWKHVESQNSLVGKVSVHGRIWLGEVASS